MKGGHRAGICGSAVVEEGEIVNIKDISSINIRIARSLSGVADAFLKMMANKQIKGVLLAGPPSSGKTTILKDIAKQLAGGYYGYNVKVAVVDERGELGAVYAGESKNDLGISCDVLDGYPKAQGMMQAIRCLSPDLIICDEIGTEQEARAVESCLNAGVRVIASVHAAGKEELRNRPSVRRLLATGAFDSIVLLKGRGAPGVIKAVYRAADLLAGSVEHDQNGGHCGDCFDIGGGGDCEVDGAGQTGATA